MDDKDRQDTKPETTGSEAESADELHEPDEADETEVEDELEELPEPEEGERRTGAGRRSLPWAAVVVLVILIGAGLYAAWPSIQRSVETPSFEPEDEAALPSEGEAVEAGPEDEGAGSEVDLVMSDEGLATVREEPDLPEDIPAPELAMPDGEVGSPEMAEVTTPEVGGPSAIVEQGELVEPKVAPAEEPEVLIVVEAEGEGPAEAAEAEPTDVAALSERIAQLESLIAERVGVPPPAAPDDGQMMSDVLTRMDDGGPGQEPAARAPGVPARAPAVDLGPLEARIDSLEDKFNEVADPSPELDALRIEAMGLRDAVSAVDQRIGELETRLEERSAVNGQLVTMVLAVDRLAAAAAGSGPFVRELEAARNAGGKDAGIAQALDELEPFAVSGVPTIADLRSGFDTMALRVVRASALPEDGGWIDETIARLKRIVAVRKTGDDVEPNSLDGRLVRAERALARGGLSEAVLIIDKLPGRASEGANEWLAMAQSRLHVNQTLAALEQHVADRVETRWLDKASAGG